MEPLMPADDDGLSTAPCLQCEGWWEQEGFGRQPMQQLCLQFAAGAISGAGVDIIGPFTLEGTISNDARVLILKQYIGRHRVQYFGKYDGEGLLWGDWRIGLLTGPWLIRLRPGNAGASEEIETLAPESLK
jgi:hypothetical protein